jgi:hypothetical protein
MIVAAACTLGASAAHAGVTAVPEPGILELIAIGGVLAVGVAFRNRRGK